MGRIHHEVGKYSPSSSPIVQRIKHEVGRGINDINGAQYLGGKVAAGAASIGIGAWNMIAGTFDQIMGDTYSAEKRYAENSARAFSEKLDEQYTANGAMKFAGAVAEGVGQFIPSLVVSMVPVVGTGVASTLQFTAYTGMNVEEAYNKTGNLGAKEYIYGAAMGGFETALEFVGGKVGGWMGKTKVGGKLLGVSDNVAKATVKATSGKIGAKGATILGRTLAGGASEFTEEFIEAYAEVGMQRALQIDPNASIKLGEALYAGAVGFASGAAISGTASVLNTKGAQMTGARIMKAGEVEMTISAATEISSAFKSIGQMESGVHKMLADNLSAWADMKDKTTGSAQMVLGNIEVCMNVLSAMAKQQGTVLAVNANPEKFLGYAKSLFGDSVTLEDLKSPDSRVVRFIAASNWATGEADALAIRAKRSQFDATIRAEENGSQAVAPIGSEWNGQDAVFKTADGEYVIVSSGKSGGYTVMKGKGLNDLQAISKDGSTVIGEEDVSAALRQFSTQSTANAQEQAAEVVAEQSPAPEENAPTEQTAEQPKSAEKKATPKDAEDKEARGGKETPTEGKKEGEEPKQNVLSNKNSRERARLIDEYDADVQDKARKVFKDVDKLSADRRIAVYEAIRTGKEVSADVLSAACYFLSKRPGLFIRFAEKVEEKEKKSGFRRAVFGGRARLVLAAGGPKGLRKVLIHEIFHDVADTVAGKKLLDAAMESVSAEKAYNTARIYGNHYAKVHGDRGVETFEKFFEDGKYNKEDSKSVVEAIAAYEKKYEGILPKRAITEEIAADVTAELVGNEKFLKMAKDTNATGIVLRCLHRMMVYLKSKKEAKPLYAMTCDFEDLFLDAVNSGYGTWDASVQGIDVTRYNLAAVATHMAKLQAAYSKDASVDADELQRRYAKIVEMWEHLGGDLNSEFLNNWNNKKGKDRAFTVFKAQAGYKYNAELSSMCKKGVPLFEAIDTIVKREVSKQLDSKVISKQEKEILYDILKSRGFEIPCAICYVEQARQREGVIIDAFLNGAGGNGSEVNEKFKLGWNSVIADVEKEMNRRGVDYKFPSLDRSVATDAYAPATHEMSETEQNAFYAVLKKLANEEINRYNREEGKNRPLLAGVTPADVKAAFKGTLPANLKIFKTLFTEPESRFTIDDDLLYSSETTQNLAAYHSALYSLFNAQGGVSGYKTEQKPVVYWGDILGKTWRPRTLRDHGGIRNQSNSDFQAYTLLDQVQMYVDLTAKGYYLQAYTKVLAELKLFGLSGAKINASLIPRVHLFYKADGSVDVEKTRANAGLDERGNPIYDDFEGIPHEEAFMLIEDARYSKSVGGVCIGYSDNHISALLDDDRVQLIIGYHDKSNDPKKRYRGAVYAKNYNGVNEAVRADGKTEHVGFNTFVREAEGMFKLDKKSETYSGKVAHNGKTYDANDIPCLAADLYLEFCKNKGYSPAYSGRDGGVDFSTHRNYYKLLADFSLYDSEGNYAPHKRVAFSMPENVPFIAEDGKRGQISTEKYIKQELSKELKVRDDISATLADTSDGGIIPEFVRRANALQAEQKNTAEDGDVRYAFVGQTADGIEVYETSKATMALEWKERKARYLDVMKNEYRGRTAKFKRNGHFYYAEFDQSSIRKPVYGDSRSSPHGVKALVNAGADGDAFNLVENTEYRRSKPNTKDHTKADYFDYFVKTVQIDGKVFDLVADVEKKYGGEGGYVYTLALTENKKIKALPTHGTPNVGPVKNVGNASTNIISFFAEKVKSQPQEISPAKQKIDRDYIDAVNRGDTETAQRMVDEESDGGRYSLNDDVSAAEQVVQKASRARTSRAMNESDKARLGRGWFYQKKDTKSALAQFLFDGHFVDEYTSLKLKFKDLDEVSRYLWEQMNKNGPDHMDRAANVVADYMISKMVVENAIAAEEHERAKAIRRILKPYYKNMSLDESRRTELRSVLGKDMAQRFINTFSSGQKRGIDIDGDAADINAQLEVEDLYEFRINAENDKDALIGFADMYFKMRELEKEPIYTSAESLFSSEKDVADFRAKTKEAILKAMEKDGKPGELRALAEVKDKAYDRLYEKWRETREKYEGAVKTKYSVADAVFLAKEVGEMVSKRKYVNAAELITPEMEAIGKTLSSLATPRKLKEKEVRQVMKVLSAWYTPQNLDADSASENGEAIETSMYHPDIKEKIDRIAGGQENAQLTYEEIRDLAQVLSAVRKVIQNYDMVTLDGHRVRATEAATSETAMLQGYIAAGNNGKGDKGGFIGKMFHNAGAAVGKKLKDNFLYRAMTPRQVIQSLEWYDENGVLTQAYNAIQDGVAGAGSDYANMMRPVVEFYDSHKKYEKRLSKTFIPYEGEEMTVAQAIALYMTTKREQAALGFAESGFRYMGKDGKVRHARARNAADIQSEIYAAFTAEDKEYIKIIETVYEQARDLKVKTDGEIFGYTNVEDGYYFPIARDTMEIAKKVSDLRQTMRDMAVVSNKSFNKNTVKGAKNALFIADVTMVTEAHAMGVAQYANLYMALSSWDRLWNKKVEGKDGKKISTRQLVGDKIWAGNNKRDVADAYFRQLFADIQGVSAEKRDGDGFYAALRATYVSAALGFNLSSILKQTGSFASACVYLSATDLAKGIVMKGDKKEMWQYSKVANGRMFERGRFVSAESNAKLENAAKWVRGFGEKTMVGVEGMDNLVVGRLWNACQQNIARTKGLALGTVENKVEAGKLLDKVINETQSSSTQDTRSAMQRGNAFMQTFTMFTSDAVKQISFLYEGAARVYSARLRRKMGKGSDAEVKAANKFLRRSIAGFIGSTALVVAIAQFIKWLLGREREEGESIAKDISQEVLGQVIGIIPIVSDIYGKIANNYDVNSFAFDAINDLLDASVSLGRNLSKVADGESVSRQDLLKPTRNLAYSLGNFTGLPVRNTFNYVIGVTKKFSPEAGYAWDALFEAPSYEADIAKAIERGDEDLAVYIMELSLKHRLGDGSYSSPVAQELLRLQAQGFADENDSVAPPHVPSSVGGVSVNADQYKQMSAILSKSGNALYDMMASDAYNDLSDDERVDAINTVYRTYLNLAKAKVMPDEEGKRTATVWASQLLGDAQSYAALGKISQIKSTDSQTRSQQVTAYLNDLDMSNDERYLVLFAAGYRSKNVLSRVRKLIANSDQYTDEEKKAFEKQYFEE